jgi:hypothetical protein
MYICFCEINLSVVLKKLSIYLYVCQSVCRSVCKVCFSLGYANSRIIYKGDILYRKVLSFIRVLEHYVDNVKVFICGPCTFNNIYKSPLNIRTGWNYESLLKTCLIVQIHAELFLTISYCFSHPVKHHMRITENNFGRRVCCLVLVKLGV